MREFAAHGIPICGDVVWSSTTGKPNVEFVHFDFLSDLSLEEGRFIRHAIRQQGEKLETPVFDTLSWLRFSLA